jgi:hypothetical protein
MQTSGFSKPVARGLHIEVSGPAIDLPSAIHTFTEAAETLVPILCVVSNAPIAQIQPELAYDITPGLKERRYFQQYLVWPSRKPLVPRRVNNDHLKAALLNLPKVPRTDRVHRAMSYYHQALMAWIPGSELFGLSFLWMGIETMTPVARDKHLATTGITRDELLIEWDIEIQKLDSEVRRRLIFAEQPDAYELAKATSDGLEHGFENFTVLREKAKKAFLPTASALRRAILRHSGLEADAVKEMLGGDLSDPFPLFHAKRLFTTLKADSDTLCEPDQLYPYFDWSSTMVEVPTPPEEDPGITFREHCTLRAAKGVSISDIRIRAAVPRTERPNGR